MDLNLIAEKAKENPTILKTWLECGMITVADAETITAIMKEKDLYLLKAKISDLHSGIIHSPTEGMPRWWTFVHDEAYPRGRRRIAKKNEYDLYVALADFYRVPFYDHDKTISLETLYPDWLSYKELHVGASTYMVRIKSDWKSMYLNNPIIKKDVRNLTKLDLDEWAHALIREHDLTKNAYYNCTMIMRQILDYAVDKQIITVNPFSQVKVNTQRVCRKVIKQDSEEEVFTAEEQAMMIRHAWDDFRNNGKLQFPLASLAVALQFQTGLRVGELCGLMFSDIKVCASGCTLRVQRFIRKQTEIVDGAKTPAGIREIPLPDQSLALIEVCRQWQEKHYGFVGEFIFSGHEPLKPRTISDRYVSFCKQLGINKRSSHKARKTYVSTLVDAGINLETIRKTVGHASSSVTLRNYTFDRAEREERNKKIVDAVTR